MGNLLMSMTFNRESMKAYLDDTVTVGQLLRWINAEAVNAGKKGDRDNLAALARIGEQVEAAHSLYYSALPNA